MFLTFVNTDSEVILFALAVAIGEPITPAIEVLRKARCAPPGDPKLPRGLSR